MRLPFGGSRVLFAGVLVGTAAAFGGSGVQGAKQSGSSDTLTFNRDIAPIVFEHCASCHRPGRPTPFDLLTYQDVKVRSQLIADAVERRYMPPWLPEPGFVDFVGDRLLSDEQIEAFRRWADEGAVQGNAADLPPTPRWNEAWQLGEPDLVVTLPAYTAPAAGRDRYRNLVASIPVDETRYVSTVELRWGDTRVVHHARMMVDTTASSRLFDEGDPQPGFDGMEIVSDADNPPGHFVGWAPGRVPVRGAQDIAWPLDPGTDLVLQLHLRPTGRPEIVRPQVGFHFTDRPPTKATALIMLGSFEIDIPPGESDYLVSDTYQLPVDVQVLGLYPHAHYIGKRVWGIATRPNGDTQWLIRIDRWDFNSQDEYRYEKPIFLPAGTTLSMQWTYDNSTGNPFNPNNPPERVVYGSLSTDEMSDLVIQVLPATRSELDILKRDLAWKYETRDVIYLARREHRIGDELAEQGKFSEAITHFQEALRLKTDDAGVHVSLARAVASMGDFSTAITIAERAMQLAAAAGDEELGVVIRERLRTYRQRNRD